MTYLDQNRSNPNGRNQRIFPVVASSSEGLLTERRTAAQPYWRERAFMRLMYGPAAFRN
jgi:hypothetical protein